MPEVMTFDQISQVPWIDGIFLGWLESRRPFSTMLFSAREDSLAIIGPPRSGKTAGLLIPAAMTWPGSAISASTKPDVLAATRIRRMECAALRGGDVAVFSPASPEVHTMGVRHVRWSPLVGCEDPVLCEERVAKIIGPRRQDQNEDEFFRQQAATVLRGYFHAAALARIGMKRMKRWVDDNDVTEAMDILHSMSDERPSAAAYFSSLRGIDKQGPNTKSSTFSTVNGKLGPLVNNATVLDNMEDPDFDIDAFLTTGSTLYIVSPENVQDVVAPVLAAFVEAIVTRAYFLASRSPSGRIDPALLLLLDEVGAIAPLPSLPQIMAQGASQGVLAVWAAQSFSQLKARWGDDWAKSIFGASCHKIIFGNTTADTDLLGQISDSFGERDTWKVAPQGRGAAIAAILGRGSSMGPTHMKERNLKLEDLFRQGAGKATIIASTREGPQPLRIDVPPAATVHPFAPVIESARAGDRLGETDAPDPLRQKLLARRTVIFNSMSRKEQERFRKEEAGLLGRIERVEAASSPERERMMQQDPELAREVRAHSHLLTEAPNTILEAQVGVLEAFASGRIARFSYSFMYPDDPVPEERRPPKPRPPRSPIWVEKR